MEQRSVRRYRIQLPVTYFWGSKNNFLEGHGTTRDISVHGAFIVATDEIPRGSDLWMRLTIPAMREGLAGSEMQGTGKVVRSDRDGFAVEASIGFSAEFASGDHINKKSRETSSQKPENSAPVVPVPDEVLA